MRNSQGITVHLDMPVDVHFDNLLREGIMHIGQRASWLHILGKVPLVKWPEFITAMRSTEASHRAFRRP